ncbi:hypothetical protein [Desulfosporosinus sp.]|uniref:hypothetical protein n=1 Tax=Desulfosporosinus sp. TaxID=157907 RepID=UPI00262BCCBC|nr:hypothetical protein [Desulfosporosinus sp.]
MAATRREEIKQALQGISIKDSQAKNDQSDSEEWTNKSNYADSIAEIVYDTKLKKNAKKN